MDVTLLITLVSLLFAVLTYFLGIHRGRRYRAEDRQAREAQERQTRIIRVVEGYINLALSSQDSGPHALIRVGVRDLRDNGEIREALDTISDHTGKQPFPQDDASQLVDADLKAFFDALKMDRLAIPNYKEVLERFRRSKT